MMLNRLNVLRCTMKIISRPGANYNVSLIMDGSILEMVAVAVVQRTEWMYFRDMAQTDTTIHMEQHILIQYIYIKHDNYFIEKV